MYVLPSIVIISRDRRTNTINYVSVYKEYNHFVSVCENYSPLFYCAPFVPF
jgi:hypothetical protein